MIMQAEGHFWPLDNVTELAESIYEPSLGMNWTSCFVQHYKDHLQARYFGFEEMTRLQADKMERRSAFHSLTSLCDHLAVRFTPILMTSPMLQVKDIYDSMPPISYSAWMRLTLTLAISKQKVKNITQCIRACNGQAVPPSSAHITSITTIEIDSALVPRLIIYQGAHLQDAWTSTCDKNVSQLAYVT